MTVGERSNTGVDTGPKRWSALRITLYQQGHGRLRPQLVRFPGPAPGDGRAGPANLRGHGIDTTQSFDHRTPLRPLENIRMRDTALLGPPAAACAPTAVCGRHRSPCRKPRCRAPDGVAGISGVNPSGLQRHITGKSESHGEGRVDGGSAIVVRHTHLQNRANEPSLTAQKPGFERDL